MTTNVLDGAVSLQDKVSALLGELSRAGTYDAALAALDMADLETLRAIEAEFNFLPAASGVIRDSIARAHVKRMSRRSGFVRHTKKVIPGMVQGWALAALCEALRGYTDLEDKTGQYHLALIEAPDDGTGRAVFEVSTVERMDPRRFVIRVHAEELPAADEVAV